VEAQQTKNIEITAGLRPRLTLERIGFWTIVLLVIYFLMVTAIIAYERNVMATSVIDLQEVHQREERLVALNINVSRTILAINEHYFSPDIDDAAKILVLELEAILPGLRRLQESFSILDGDVEAIGLALNELTTTPTRGTIAELRTLVHRLVIELDVITDDIHSQKQRTVERYQTTFNRVTLEWLIFGVIGLAIMGGIILIFFRNLANDIRLVHARALAIVQGYRAAPLTHNRSDELGALMDAVNWMQQELRRRESQVELSRQQHFHKEKMAAVGSLAASVAHEINNPLAAIVGIAESIDAECQSTHCRRRGDNCHPALILDQARRVMQITRRISEFSVPQSQEPELLDVNGILRSTCNFVAFDRRFRLLELATEFDSNLPAVYGVADHLVQVAMNLLINAADALKDRTEPLPKILVQTRRSDDCVLVEITDNGTGIEEVILGLVFNEYFTTKGPGHGSGLGLAVCRSLIRDAGGDITIASKLGIGTSVTVFLPISGNENGTGNGAVNGE
jgi:two-component system, NtrC family, sensor kinase